MRSEKARERKSEKSPALSPGAIALMTAMSTMSARYVELDSVLVPGTINQRTFSVPDGRVLPRGYYMMFALTNANIPSVAEWVKLQ